MYWPNDGGVPSLLLESLTKGSELLFSSLYLTCLFFLCFFFLVLSSPFISSSFFLSLSSSLVLFPASPRGEDPAVADAPWGLHPREFFHCESIHHLRVYTDIYPLHFVPIAILTPIYKTISTSNQLCWSATSCFLAPSCIPPLAANFLPEYFLVPTRETSSSRLVSLNWVLRL